MRRRYQRGSIKDDGDRWEIRWREDVVKDGQVKRVNRWDVLSKKSYPTKRLAQRELDERLREVNREDYKPVPTEVFSAFARRWMDTVMVNQKPSGQRADRSRINVHLIPAFGKFQLREMTAEVLQTWIAQKKDLEPKSIRNIVRTLSSMWTTAKAWGYVRHDPFEGLSLPAVEKGRAYFFSPEETLAIIEEAQGWHKLFFLVLAATGIRPGELAGLRIEDLAPTFICVRQSVWQGKVQTPKTKTAVRKFAIPRELYEMLAKNIRANEHNLLFPNDVGRPLSIDNLRNRTLNPILRKLGIAEKIKAAGVRCGNYAFRHGNATVMDVLNIPLKTRQKRLGHVDPETTMGYTHAVDSEDVAAAEQIWALLRPKKDGEAVQ